MNRSKFMRLEWGPCPNVCANCFHLKPDHFRPNVMKCEVYGRTSSEATDWDKTWPACGAFNQVTKTRNLYTLLTETKKSKKSKELDGQIGFRMEVEK